jgi:hypothetical protein
MLLSNKSKRVTIVIDTLKCYVWFNSQQVADIARWNIYFFSVAAISYSYDLLNRTI